MSLSIATNGMHWFIGGTSLGDFVGMKPLAVSALASTPTGGSGASIAPGGLSAQGDAPLVPEGVEGGSVRPTDARGGSIRPKPYFAGEE